MASMGPDENFDRWFEQEWGRIIRGSGDRLEGDGGGLKAALRQAFKAGWRAAVRGHIAPHIEVPGDYEEAKDR